MDLFGSRSKNYFVFVSFERKQILIIVFCGGNPAFHVNRCARNLFVSSAPGKFVFGTVIMCCTLEINVSDHHVNESLQTPYDDLKEIAQWELPPRKFKIQVLSFLV